MQLYDWISSYRIYHVINIYILNEGGSRNKSLILLMMIYEVTSDDLIASDDESFTRVIAVCVNTRAKCY